MFGWVLNYGFFCSKQIQFPFRIPEGRVFRDPELQSGQRELGSSRVPVSRVLEAFAAEGVLELARGKIVVRDRQKLQAKGRGA